MIDTKIRAIYMIMLGKRWYVSPGEEVIDSFRICKYDFDVMLTIADARENIFKISNKPGGLKVAKHIVEAL